MAQPRDLFGEPVTLGGLHAVVAVRGGETLLGYYGVGADFAWGEPLGVVEFGPETPPANNPP